MRALRFRYLWFFGGLVLVAVVLYSTLMPAATLPITMYNDKAAHAITFVVLMVWFCGVFEMRFAPLVGIALLGFGGSIEGLQFLLAYRSAELADVLADAAGIGLGWALAVSGLQYWGEWVESWVPRA